MIDHAAKLHKLDALRGFAALYVACTHVLPRSIHIGPLELGWALKFGQEAVILFFLLSGFVIHYSQSIAVDKRFVVYLVKRATRIYIPLLIVFLLGYLIDSEQAGELVSVDGLALLGNLFMLQDWGWARPNVIVEPILGIGALWSLSYEWWFYMLYYPISRLDTTRERRNLIVLAVCVMAGLIHVWWPGFVPRLLMYLVIWWIGVMLADRYMTRDSRILIPMLPVITAVCTIVSIQIIGRWQEISSLDPIIFGQHPLIEIRHMVFGLAAALFALFWQKLHWIGFRYLLGPFALLAPISYMLYIAHHHFLGVVDYLAFIDNRALEMLGYFIVLVIVCHLVERRIYPGARRWLMKRIQM